MAAFHPRDWDAFAAHWVTRVLRPENVTRTLQVGDEIVGYVGSWSEDGRRLVGYWIGRAYWGRGIATRALAALLLEEPVRPLHALVAAHNVGSIRVLEKCGFRPEPEGTQRHDDGVVELLLKLER